MSEAVVSFVFFCEVQCQWIHINSFVDPEGISDDKLLACTR